MKKTKISPVYVRDAERLGISQRKILQIIESSREGLTFSQIFERLNLIPVVMGSMLDIFADMRLSLEGKKPFMQKKEVFRALRILIEKCEVYLIAEDGEMIKDEVGVFDKLYYTKGGLKRLDTYIKLETLDSLRKNLNSAEGQLERVEELEEVYNNLIGIAIQITKVAESIESYRQEMRTMQAVGSEDRKEVAQRHALAKRLRATLHRALDTLKSRGLVLEISYPEEVQWTDVRSRFVITKKGYLALQDVKERKGKVFPNVIRPVAP